MRRSPSTKLRAGGAASPPHVHPGTRNHLGTGRGGGFTERRVEPRAIEVQTGAVQVEDEVVDCEDRRIPTPTRWRSRSGARPP